MACDVSLPSERYWYIYLLAIMKWFGKYPTSSEECRDFCCVLVFNTLPLGESWNVALFKIAGKQRPVATDDSIRILYHEAERSHRIDTGSWAHFRGHPFAPIIVGIPVLGSGLICIDGWRAPAQQRRPGRVRRAIMYTPVSWKQERYSERNINSDFCAVPILPRRYGGFKSCSNKCERNMNGDFKGSGWKHKGYSLD